MMAEAEAAVGRGPMARATAYRNGLMLALLAAHLLRAANFAAIGIGHHLRRVGTGWRLTFEPGETKTRGAIELPPTSSAASRSTWTAGGRSCSAQQPLHPHQHGHPAAARPGPEPAPPPRLPRHQHRGRGSGEHPHGGGPARAPDARHHPEALQRRPAARGGRAVAAEPARAAAPGQVTAGRSRRPAGRTGAGSFPAGSARRTASRGAARIRRIEI
jgi:hypothetical protein